VFRTTNRCEPGEVWGGMVSETNSTSGYRQPSADTTFEPHYTIGDLSKQWRIGRETVRLLVKDEPGVVKIRMGRRKSMTRYSVPESVARRVHTRLFNPAV
jgi:hypothetical protein